MKITENKKSEKFEAIRTFAALYFFSVIIKKNN